MARNTVTAFVVAAAMIATGASLWASGAGQKEVQIPVPRVSSLDGAELYKAYCASCHGPIGKGNGPISTQLDHRFPDLTLITDRDGKYNATHVTYHILWTRGELVPPRTANEPMPDWDSHLRRNYSGNPMAAYVAALNLAHYVETLQVTPAANKDPRK